jgi:FkbM family methyltransferase
MKFFQLLIKIKIFKRILPSLIRKFLILIKKPIHLSQYLGVNFQIDINDPLDRELFFYNSYEKEQINYLEKIIKKEKINFFIDIGANFGIYSLIISKKFPKIKIFSFEPIKESFIKFKKNIKLNKKIKNIKVYSIGLSSKKTNLNMSALIKNNYVQLGGFGVRKKDEEGPNDNFHFQKYSFEKGDKFIKFKNKRVAFKIDVEGHELDVLKGLKKALNINKSILQIEIFDNKFRKTNAFLKKNNFRQIQKITDKNKSDYYYINF